MLNLIGKTLLSHSKIINNQSQVLVDSIEVLEFLSHLVGLLVEHLNFKFSRTNVSLKLLDLVIQDKFEFLKLLSLLLEINDSLVFVFDVVSRSLSSPS